MATSTSSLFTLLPYLVILELQGNGALPQEARGHAKNSYYVSPDSLPGTVLDTREQER